MISGSVQTFSDPLLYQKVFHAADVEILPTTRGRFSAKLTQIRLNKVWMQRGDESLPRVMRATVSPSRAAFGFLSDAQQSQHYHCGTEVPSDALVVNNSDLMHRRTDGASRWATISLPREELRSASKVLCGHELDELLLAPLVRPNRNRMARLCYLHQQLGKIVEELLESLVDAEAVRAIESEIISVLVQCLDEQSPVTTTYAGRNHSKIIRHFEEFLAQNRFQPIYLSEICSATGASERILQASCREHFGMSPVRYLWLRRMHLARRALLLATPETATVTEIAMDHGFWELGRFSTQYRSFFGESASATLRRPPSEN